MGPPCLYYETAWIWPLSLSGSAMNRPRQRRFTCTRTCKLRNVHWLMQPRLARYLAVIVRQTRYCSSLKASDYADSMSAQAERSHDNGPPVRATRHNSEDGILW